MGHDIYCTTWERLQKDAGYEHPNISKLMDARIVYCADEKYRERLETLRKAAREILEAPFSEEDYARAEKQLKEAEHCYTAPPAPFSTSGLWAEIIAWMRRTAQSYDAILNAYREEYAKAGIQVKHYSDIDAFVRDYE